MGHCIEFSRLDLIRRAQQRLGALPRARGGHSETQVGRWERTSKSLSGSLSEANTLRVNREKNHAGRLKEERCRSRSR